MLGVDDGGVEVGIGYTAGSVHQFPAENGLGTEVKTKDKTVQFRAPVDLNCCQFRSTT